MRSCLFFLIVILVGCGSPPSGTWRMWEDQWTALRVDREWVRGVNLGVELSLEIGRGERRFRARVLNPNDQPEDLTFSGSGASNRWEIPAGGFLDVDTGPLTRGQYLIEGPPNLILGEPRLVKEEFQPELLVFVVVDTLRAQAVNPEEMPLILDALKGARNFRDTTANSPWTLPSMASMFTSRQVLDLTTPTGDLIGIPDGFDTWAAALRNEGFTGGGIVANYTVHVQNGYAQGFDTYAVQDIIPKDGGLPDAAWVVQHAERWLNAHRGEKAFLYLHLMDPHEPYRDHEQGLPAPDLFGLAHRKREATAEESQRLRELYDGEVRHVDEILGPFLEALPDEAVIVFTGDHGEALGEHGCWAHGFTLYEPVVRVPLIIKAREFDSGNDLRQTQLLDLAPTVLDIFDITPPPTMEGISLLKGGSQTATISATFSPGPLRWMWRRGSIKVVVRTADQPLVVGGSRKTVEEDDPLPEGVFCYNLETDPEELEPGPVPSDILPDVVRDFAFSAGSLVPGLQVYSVGAEAGSEIEFSVSGAGDFGQIWSVSPLDAVCTDSNVTIKTAQAEPFRLVAIGEGDPSAEFSAGEATPPWRDLQSQGTVSPKELQPDQRFDVPGTYVWWNPSRELVVGHLDETMEKLRALGYIE